MVQLGLVDDDEYDDYEMYEDSHAMAGGVRGRSAVEQLDPPASQVRPLPRDYEGSGVTLQPQRPAVVRPVSAVQNARVHVVAPTMFADAQEIGDRLKTNQPVIVNLQEVDP
jgi:cell division inhibitor SepF